VDRRIDIRPAPPAYLGALLISAGVHGGVLIWAASPSPSVPVAAPSAPAPVALLSLAPPERAVVPPVAKPNPAPARSENAPAPVRPKPVSRPVSRATVPSPAPEREAVAPSPPAATSPSLAASAGAAEPEPSAPAGPEQAASPAPAASQSEGEPPLITVPRFRHPPAPASYPKRAMDTNQQGTVLVRALVGTDGRPRVVRVWETSGFRLLDNAAETAVRGWIFEPAYWNGRHTEAWVQVPVHFVLR